MTAFIEENREPHGLEPMYKILQIAPSTYYDRRAVAGDADLTYARAKSHAALSVKIDAAWEDNRRLFGTIGYIPPAEAEEAYYANLNSLDMFA